MKFGGFEGVSSWLTAQQVLGILQEMNPDFIPFRPDGTLEQKHERRESFDCCCSMESISGGGWRTPKLSKLDASLDWEGRK